MVLVSTTKLYACLMDAGKCTFDEVKAFVETELEYFDSIEKYEIVDGEEVYDINDLHYYICENTGLNQFLIGELLVIQADITDDDIPLADEFKAVHNMLKKMSLEHFYEVQEEFYDNGLEYFEKLCSRILEENQSDMNSKDFIQFYMDDHGYKFDQDGFYIQDEVYK